LYSAEQYPPAGEYAPYLFGRAGRDRLQRDVETIAFYFLKRGDILSFQYYDGKTLNEISGEKAVRLAKDYGTRIRREWAKNESKYGKEAAG
jgi:hypothetical protein